MNNEEAWDAFDEALDEERKYREAIDKISQRLGFYGEADDAHYADLRPAQGDWNRARWLKAYWYARATGVESAAAESRADMQVGEWAR